MPALKGLAVFVTAVFVITTLSFLLPDLIASVVNNAHDFIIVSQAGTIDIPLTGQWPPYVSTKDKQEALDAIKIAIATLVALAAREGGIQVLLRGTSLTTAVQEQNNFAFRYDGSDGRLWTFPLSGTAVAEAAFYAILNTIDAGENTGAISIWGMQQAIYDINRGGKTMPIWNRFGREAGISSSLDSYLIGPTIIAIPLDVLQQIK
jgi:hypothetical protein